MTINSTVVKIETTGDLIQWLSVNNHQLLAKVLESKFARLKCPLKTITNKYLQSLGCTQKEIATFNFAQILSSRAHIGTPTRTRKAPSSFSRIIASPKNKRNAARSLSVRSPRVLVESESLQHLVESVNNLNSVINEKFEEVEAQNRSFQKEIKVLKQQLSSIEVPELPRRGAPVGDEDAEFLQQRLEASQNLVDDLRTSLEDLEIKHENLMDDYDDLKHEYTECKEEKLFLEDERRRLGDLFGEQMQTLQDQNQLLQAKLDGKPEADDERMKQNKKKLKAQSEEFDAIRRQGVKELEEECKNLREQIKALESVNNTEDDLHSGIMNEMMAPNKEFVEYLEGRIQEMEEDHGALASRNQTLESENEEMQTKISELERGSNTELVKYLEETIQSLEADVENLNRQNESLEEQYNESIDQLDILKIELQTLKEFQNPKIKTLPNSDEIMQLRKRCKKLEKLKVELERKNTSLSDSLSKMSLTYTNEGKIVSLLDQAFLGFKEEQEDTQKTIDLLREECVLEDENRAEIDQELNLLDIKEGREIADIEKRREETVKMLQKQEDTDSLIEQIRLKFQREIEEVKTRYEFRKKNIDVYTTPEIEASTQKLERSRIKFNRFREKVEDIIDRYFA